MSSSPPKAGGIVKELYDACVVALKNFNLTKDSTFNIDRALQRLESCGDTLLKKIGALDLANDEEIEPLRDFLTGTLGDIAVTLDGLLTAYGGMSGQAEDLGQHRLSELLSREEVAAQTMDIPPYLLVEHLDNADYKRLVAQCASDLDALGSTLADAGALFSMERGFGSHPPLPTDTDGDDDVDSRSPSADEQDHDPSPETQSTHVAGQQVGQPVDQNPILRDPRNEQQPIPRNPRNERQPLRLQYDRGRDTESASLWDQLNQQTRIGRDQNSRRPVAAPMPRNKGRDFSK